MDECNIKGYNTNNDIDAMLHHVKNTEALDGIVASLAARIQQ
jgi:hypothetical protein